MSRVVVDLERLAELVDRMEVFQAQLTRAGNDADARVRQLHGSWTGTAADTQSAAHAQWRAGASEVQETLAVLRSIVSGAHANYHAAALANRRMWAP
jgi:WXG100 family type VII secretion target